ncbi:MAG TPA: hypothetical protein P5158_00560 [Chitinophagaceae bacterium]|nr:hypothetical protein [Chitinophagaceae bacterium]
MKNLFFFIVMVYLYSSCSNDEQRNLPQENKDFESISHFSLDSAFLHNFQILDSVVKTKPKDTLYQCCYHSIAFMEKNTRIEADVDGDYIGPIGFKKEDLKRWHDWYDKEFLK